MSKFQKITLFLKGYLLKQSTDMVLSWPLEKEQLSTSIVFRRPVLVMHVSVCGCSYFLGLDQNT